MLTRSNDGYNPFRRINLSDLTVHAFLYDALLQMWLFLGKSCVIINLVFLQFGLNHNFRATFFPLQHIMLVLQKK